MTDGIPLDPPLRAEVIGSLLRPRSLKTAAQQSPVARDGRHYAALLEHEIARVIAKQVAIGLRVVTDGELGRSSWFGFFFEAMDGVSLARAHFTFRDVEGRTFAWPTRRGRAADPSPEADPVAGLHACSSPGAHCGRQGDLAGA